MIDTTTSATTPTTPLRDLGLTKDVADPNANDLDKDAFLQLLVAQLRYQDPLDPSDPAEFMATTAQFTVVEKLDELTQQGANTAIISGLSMASSLVGRTVTFMGSDDTLQTGVVSSAQVSNGEVRLVTDAGVVDLSTVIGIGETKGSPDQTTPSQAATPPEGESTTPITPAAADDADTALPVADTALPVADTAIPVVETLPTAPLLTAPSPTTPETSISSPVSTATDVPTTSGADQASDSLSTKEPTQ